MLQGAGKLAGVAYMRRAHKLRTWLAPGGAGEVAGLRKRVLSGQLPCKRLATMATDTVHSLAKHWAGPVTQVQALADGGRGLPQENGDATAAKPEVLAAAGEAGVHSHSRPDNIGASEPAA